MNTLEQRHYVATESDIVTIGTRLMDGLELADTSRMSYLRSVIGTAQHDLDITPRASKGKATKLEPAEIERQLNGVNAVHDRFYAVLLKTIGERVPKGKDHAAEVNRLTNFARTAVYAIRQWVKAGRDLGRVIPDTASKRTLAVEGPKRQRRVSTIVLRKRVERQNKEFLTAVLALAETDKAAAIGELKMVIGQLSQQLSELGHMRATTDPKIAADEHRPLRVGKALYVPVTETQVIRQQANPS